MTIEQNIERIANALEALVQIAGGKTVAPVPSMTPAPKSVITGAAPSAPVSPIIPPTASPVAPQNAEAIPANGEQLRALAASIAQELGKDAKTAPKVLVFTNWVSSMLQQYAVSKLIEVRPEHLASVAREIYAWARKEGVNV